MIFLYRRKTKHRLIGRFNQYYNLVQFVKKAITLGHIKKANIHEYFIK